MNPETKKCQNCKEDFIIESEDFEFYKKIDVPPPTFCPTCRFQRRFIFYNLNNLFWRENYLTKEKVFSTIPPDFSGRVYDTKYWWGDDWDPMEYGRDYDFSRPFFEQLKELSREVPFPSRSIVNLVNSDYSANATDIKNCYLLFNAQKDENCMYGVTIGRSKECLDSYSVFDSELCYDSFAITSSYQTLYSENCNNCQNVYLSRDLSDCQDCLGCAGLRNKRYCIFNKQYSKKEYEEKISRFNLGSHQEIKDLKQKAREVILTIPHRSMNGIKNHNVSGDYIYNCKNVKGSYNVIKSENIKYSYNLAYGNSQDSYDQTAFGNNTELVYESEQIGNNSSRVKFSFLCYNGNSDLEYCIECISSSNLFGCVSLRNKKYCIFNKQYKKEEYFDLIKKIKKHMDEMKFTDDVGNLYKYGEFMPPEISPYAYNNTVAQEYFPLKSQEAKQKGYRWMDKKEREYEITIKSNELPDDISKVEDSILNEVIECEHSGKCSDNCTTAFKITKAELEFYRRLGVPLPRSCFYCRHAERLKKRNPLKLWKRTCMKEGCETEFETTYAPDRPEIVYCKECYQQEEIY